MRTRRKVELPFAHEAETFHHGEGRRIALQRESDNLGQPGCLPGERQRAAPRLGGLPLTPGIGHQRIPQLHLITTPYLASGELDRTQRHPGTADDPPPEPVHLPVPDRLIEYPLDLPSAARTAEHPGHSLIRPQSSQKRQVGRRDRLSRQPSRRETHPCKPTTPEGSALTVDVGQSWMVPSMTSRRRGRRRVSVDVSSFPTAE